VNQAVFPGLYSANYSATISRRFGKSFYFNSFQSHAYQSGVEHLQDVMWVNADKESPFASVDINEREFKNAALHEYRKGLFCAEWGGSADHIARVALGYRRVAGADVLVPGLACEFFGGNLAVAVHQYNQGAADFVLHDKRFYDCMFRDIEFAR